MIRFLSAFLEDEETRVLNDFRRGADLDDRDEDLYSGPSAGFMFDKLSVRNYAAMQLALHLKLRTDLDASWQEADWQTLRANVNEALARRKQ